MLSLYLHIPFCRHKCTYCSFFVLPEDDEQVDSDKIEQMKGRYLKELQGELGDWKAIFPQEEVKTVYIGGGTPFQLGPERLFELIDEVLETWGSDSLEELTIELNPDPFDEVMAFVEQAIKKYRKLYRLRFSFGIQTFDDELLQQANRGYIFNQLPTFFRELQEIKEAHVSYNFDFIAFGKFNETKQGEMQLWTPQKREFFKNLAASNLADGYSIYTLELFPGSVRYYQQKDKHKILPSGDDDQIIDEFHWLREQIQDAGYQRYEISNFARAGQPSLHNIAYRTGSSYLGIGINAASYLTRKTRQHAQKSDSPFYKTLKPAFEDDTTQAIRFHNTPARSDYWSAEKIAADKIEQLDNKELLYEELMLGLRLARGVPSISRFSPVLVDDREEQVAELHDQGLLLVDGEDIKLTNKGMNLYNSVFQSLTK